MAFSYSWTVSSMIFSPACFPARSPSRNPLSYARFSKCAICSAGNASRSSEPSTERTFSFFAPVLPRMILEDIVVSAGADSKHAFFFQLPHDFHNPLLSRVNILRLYGAHDVDLFLHHFNGTVGHVAEELLLQLFVGTFQSLRNG